MGENVYYVFSETELLGDNVDSLGSEIDLGGDNIDDLGSESDLGSNNVDDLTGEASTGDFENSETVEESVEPSGDVGGADFGGGGDGNIY